MNDLLSLSYILTTFNKLSYLKITLPHLIRACQEDEEIVVVDGGSTDGTADYLRDLLAEKKIHQFISEKDYGEAHGTNKAILMARGQLIKIVTDDDAYSFADIQNCKKFMMQNGQIDFLGSNGASIDFIATADNEVIMKDATSYFKLWMTHKTPFLITGLGMMFRRSSLPLLGLFDANFMIIDFEYSLRVTSGKAQLAWYSGCTFVNIVNQDSNSGRHWKRLNNEKTRLDTFYGRTEHYLRNQYLRARAAAGSILKSGDHKVPMNPGLNYSVVFEKAQKKIQECGNRGEFYFSKPS